MDSAALKVRLGRMIAAVAQDPVRSSRRCRQVHPGCRVQPRSSPRFFASSSASALKLSRNSASSSCAASSCPVHGEVELAASVVEFRSCGTDSFVVVQQSSGRCVERLRQNLGLGVAGLEAGSSKLTARARNSPSESHRRWFSSNSCLTCFGANPPAPVHTCRRPPSAERSTASSRCTQFENREQVGEMVAQDVAQAAMVSSPRTSRSSVYHGPHLGHDLDVQSLGVVILQVGVDLLDQFVLVGTVRIEPEQNRHPNSVPASQPA